MATEQEIRGYLAEPIEAISVEYKSWLDLTVTADKARIAKAAIALANTGGGVIVVGFRENNQAGGVPESYPRPNEIGRYGIDAVNAAIQRFAQPPFHCQLVFAGHPTTGTEHAVIVVPGVHQTPILAARDCEGVLINSRAYVRKPGPRSEDARTPEEWRQLLDRCIRARKDEMLDAFRSILSGTTALGGPALEEDLLGAFVARASDRWLQLVENLPAEAPERFPHGGFDIAMELVAAEKEPSLVALTRKIENAQAIRLTGWPTFLVINRAPYSPTAVDEAVETWLGHPEERRTFDGPAHQDFWWISADGLLYMKRGFYEDEPEVEQYEAGTVLDFVHPIWRTAEALLFARRLAELMNGVTEVRFKFRWHGLRNRTIVSLDPRRWFAGHRVCRGVDEVKVEGRASLQEIDDNLAEILFAPLSRLYEKFDFLVIQQQGIAEEITRLKERRF